MFFASLHFQYVGYHVQILAYTRLGDGTLSFPPVRAKTFEDTPGKPSNVSFPDVTSTMGKFWLILNSIFCLFINNFL